MSGDRPFAERSLHFVGIGGAGMSGLAIVAKELGAAVTGSDNNESSYTARLRRHGIELALGYDAANVPVGAEVVFSSAIAADNPELTSARAADARVLHRGELLGEVSRLKRTIAVAGTHGKTTTCAMIAHALAACGREPAFLIGGELRSAGTNAAWGRGEWIVVEADESDRSFLHLAREVAVVTSVELDHHATYRSPSELEAAFAEFAGPAEYRIAGPGVRLEGARSYAIAARPRQADGLEPRPTDARLAEGPGPRPTDARLADGLAPRLSDARLAEGLELLPLGSRFTLAGVAVELGVPGRHNVLNALAALLACEAAGLAPAEAAPALAGFTGVGRRFEERGATASGARVFDDYAHHPTEVRATLEAARTLGARRLVACFQPHLYSRTRELAREFGRALALADLAVVLDIYPARERPEDFPGVSGLAVAQAAADAAAGGPVWWIPSIEDAVDRLGAELGGGDVLLTLGAGDVDRVAAGLVGAG